MKSLKTVDLQDALLLLGVLSLCSGIGFIYWPASLIALGVVCLVAVYLIERAPAEKPAPEPNQLKQ